MQNAELSKSSFIVVLLTIIVSDDTLFFGTPGSETFITIKYLVLIGLYIWLLTSFHRLHPSEIIPKIVCLVICGCIILSGIYNSDIRMGIFYKCFILILSLSIASRLKYQDYSAAYTKIIVAIAAISVIFMLIATISLSLLSFAPIYTNIADQPFYNFFVFLVPTDIIYLRNYGIFREPGVYQMYLIMALIFSTYGNNHFDMRNFVILSMALIFTYSTTGFIAYGVFLIMFYLQRRKTKIPKWVLVRLSLLLIVGISFLALKTDLLSTDGMIFNKLGDTNRNTTIARLASFTSTYDLWAESPIFGAGLTKTEDDFKAITYAVYGKESTNTNTLMSELATYGSLYFILIVVGLILYAKKIGLSFLGKCLIFLILVILSSGEKLTFSPFFYILCFYGWTIKPYHQNKNYIKNEYSVVC